MATARCAGNGRGDAGKRNKLASVSLREMIFGSAGMGAIWRDGGSCNSPVLRARHWLTARRALLWLQARQMIAPPVNSLPQFSHFIVRSLGDVDCQDARVYCLERSEV